LSIINSSCNRGVDININFSGENANDQSGYSVSTAGDVNGDGLDDLIIGAFGSDPSGESTAGKSYVVFGKTDSTTINLSAIASKAIRIIRILTVNDKASCANNR
jgi:hypothetical protein